MAAGGTTGASPSSTSAASTLGRQHLEARPQRRGQAARRARVDDGREAVGGEQRAQPHRLAAHDRDARALVGRDVERVLHERSAPPLREQLGRSEAGCRSGCEDDGGDHATASLARATSVASTWRFQALCGLPGRPASPSSPVELDRHVGDARGDQAHARHRCGPRRRTTSGNEKARRSPSALVGRGVGRRRQAHGRHDLARLEGQQRAVVLRRAAVEVEQRQLAHAVRARARRTAAPHAARAGARSEGCAEMQSPGCRLCLRWSPIWA